ncbi:MAG: hypothetical protein ABJO36_10920 [Litorimonas sp.]
MKDKIIGPLLDALPNEKRLVIEAFFETVTERMLENVDLENIKTSQKAALEVSNSRVDVGNRGIDLNFLTPISNLLEVPDLPQMDWGAPAPVMMANEHRLSIGYYLSNLDDWDGETCKLRQPNLDEDLMVIFYLDGVSSFSQRATLQPNHLCAFFDYDVEGYPSHGVWEVKTGPALAFKNNLLAHENDKHLIFSFHDTSIECFCSDYKYDFRKAVSIDSVTDMAKFVYS